MAVAYFLDILFCLCAGVSSYKLDNHIDLKVDSVLDVPHVIQQP